RTTYRLAEPGVRADDTIRIDPAAAAPDIRIQMVETADEADFIFVDDGEPPSCRPGPTRNRTVRVDADAPRPDLLLGFAGASVPADYRIFVRSRAIAPEAIAALFAAAHRTRHLGGQSLELRQFH